MNTFSSSIRDSLYSILGIGQPPSSSAGVEVIRQAMLHELGLAGALERPSLCGRIRRTSDATGLWLTRAELYNHLCRVHSEPVALERVRALTPLFVGRVPASLMGGRHTGSGRQRL